jgi:hypothetical protein
MGRQGVCVAAISTKTKTTASLDMDEAWEASSASSSEDEGLTVKGPLTVSTVAPSTAMTCSAKLQEAPRESQMSSRPALQKPQAPPAPLQEQSMMTLVAHLRKDNLRLRELLIDAQREALKAMETADQQAAKHGEEQPPMVNFGHFLELIKDFGEDFYSDSVHCDGVQIDASHGGAAQVFAMDEDGEDDDELADEQQPNHMKDDVVQELEARIASRDAEIAALRLELAAATAANQQQQQQQQHGNRRCTCGSQGTTDVGDDGESDDSSSTEEKAPGARSGRWV